MVVFIKEPDMIVLNAKNLNRTYYMLPEINVYFCSKLQTSKRKGKRTLLKLSLFHPFHLFKLLFLNYRETDHEIIWPCKDWPCKFKRYCTL